MEVYSLKYTNYHYIKHKKSFHNLGLWTISNVDFDKV